MEREQKQQPEGFGFRNANAARTAGAEGAKPSGPPMFSNSGRSRQTEESGKGLGFRDNAGAKPMPTREEPKPEARSDRPPQFTNSRGNSAGTRGGAGIRGGSAGRGVFGAEGGFRSNNPARK